MAEKIKEILDDQARIAALDPSSMLKLIDELPSMMQKGWDIAERTAVPKAGKINNLIISGMGGSAISGDIAGMTLKSKAGFPVIVNRSYGCPAFADSSSLLIAVSYSGNTEETISCFKEALKKGVKIISISSGGVIADLSKANKIPNVELPKGLPPRAALGYILSSVLNVIYKSGLCDTLKVDFDEAVAVMTRLQKKYGALTPSRENEVKQTATKLAGKMPVIMASEATTYASALRWKTQLNENSKVTALLAVFPELNHNDMVNFSFLKPGEHNFSFILLRDDLDPERMKKRIEITKSLISGHVGGIIEIWSQGESMLAKQMSLILYGDYLSFYLAASAGVDPTPVDIIDKLKKELSR